jgi:hypothetical protein
VVSPEDHLEYIPSYPLGSLESANHSSSREYVVNKDEELTNRDLVGFSTPFFEVEKCFRTVGIMDVWPADHP